MRSSSSADWRDLALIFGYQSDLDYWMVLLNGGCMENTNGVFRVSGGLKEKIGTACTVGSLTDMGWHDVEVVKSGSNVSVYFDGAGSPLFEAGEAPTLPGKFGFGSINDTGLVDDIRISLGQECITLPMLMGHISDWKQGSMGMPTLMQLISSWKSGTGC